MQAVQLRRSISWLATTTLCATTPALTASPSTASIPWSSGALMPLTRTRGAFPAASTARISRYRSTQQGTLAPSPVIRLSFDHAMGALCLMCMSSRHTWGRSPGMTLDKSLGACLQVGAWRTHVHLIEQCVLPLSITIALKWLLQQCSCAHQLGANHRRITSQTHAITPPSG